MLEACAAEAAVAVHVPVAGSYSSALLKKPGLLAPPATSTLPLGSSVAVCRARAVMSLPVSFHWPGVAAQGSTSSATEKRKKGNANRWTTIACGWRRDVKEDGID